jgi:hypothetical protein
MEAKSSSETSGNICHATQCNLPEDSQVYLALELSIIKLILILLPLTFLKAREKWQTLYFSGG